MQPFVSFGYVWSNAGSSRAHLQVLIFKKSPFRLSNTRLEHQCPDLGLDNPRSGDTTNKVVGVVKPHSLLAENTVIIAIRAASFSEKTYQQRTGTNREMQPLNQTCRMLSPKLMSLWPDSSMYGTSEQWPEPVGVPISSLDYETRI